MTINMQAIGRGDGWLNQYLQAIEPIVADGDSAEQAEGHLPP